MTLVLHYVMIGIVLFPGLPGAHSLFRLTQYWHGPLVCVCVCVRMKEEGTVKRNITNGGFGQ